MVGFSRDGARTGQVFKVQMGVSDLHAQYLFRMTQRLSVGGGEIGRELGRVHERFAQECDVVRCVGIVIPEMERAEAGADVSFTSQLCLDR